MGKLISGLIAVGLMLTLVVGIVYGYIHNIVLLVTQNEALGMIIGRVLGIFIAPIGIVLGYF